MPYGNRGLSGVAGPMAEGDKQFTEFVYNDTSGALSNGQPVYIDVTDSGEWNNNNATTAVTPVRANTGGNVVLGTNTNAGANLTCVGVFQPNNPAELPNKGDTIRVLTYGRGIISVQSPGGGAAGTIGGNVIASAAVKDAVPGARAAGVNIGIITATRAVVTAGATLVTAASAVSTLCNGFVDLS